MSRNPTEIRPCKFFFAMRRVAFVLLLAAVVARGADPSDVVEEDDAEYDTEDEAPRPLPPPWYTDEEWENFGRLRGMRKELDMYDELLSTDPVSASKMLPIFAEVDAPDNPPEIQGNALLALAELYEGG